MFVFLLAKCDAEGLVDVHPVVIAKLTGMPDDAVRRGLAVLEAPDPGSRTPDMEGVRLERLDEHRDWGWRIVNYLQYRLKVDSEVVKAQQNARQRKRRDKVAAVSRSVTPCHATSRQVEVEVEVDLDSVSSLCDSTAPEPALPGPDPSVEMVRNLVVGAARALDGKQKHLDRDRIWGRIKHLERKRRDDLFTFAGWLWKDDPDNALVMHILEDCLSVRPELPYAYYARDGEARLAIAARFREERAETEQRERDNAEKAFFAR